MSKSNNSTRFAHAYNVPQIFLPNGLLLDRSFHPMDSSTRILINKLLTHIFLDFNPEIGHKCTSLCGQRSQLLLGFPNSEDVKSSCPPKDAEMIEQFERWMTLILCNHDEEVTLQSIVIEFLPCNKLVEVLSISFYL